MLPILIAAVLLAALLWFGWSKPLIARGGWRLGAGLMSIAIFTCAAFVSLRGGYVKGLALLVLALGLAALARTPRSGAPGRTAAPRLSETDARSLLGVEASATPQEVKSAYARLIKRVHPDAGGAAGLAAQLNAARDRLLKG